MRDQQDGPFASFAAAILLTCLTIALWGFAHRLYTTLLPELAATEALAGPKLALARAGLALGYVLMTLPAAFVSRNFGFKIGMVFGLGLLAISMFLLYPAVERHAFPFFALAATVMGSGLALIEVMTSCLVVFLGSKESAIRRMNLIQALVPLGALAGLFSGEHILGAVLHETGGPTAHALMLPLFSLGTAIIALAFVVELVEFPPLAGERVAPDDSTWASFAPPLRLPSFRAAVVAQFLSLGAQIIIAMVAMGSFKMSVPARPFEAAPLLVWGILAFGLGRIIGPVLMLRLNPMTVLAVFSAGGIASCLAAVTGNSSAESWGLVGAGFFLSIQFPTVFAHTIRDLGEMAKTGAAIMIFVAFSGTAVLALTALFFSPQATQTLMVLPALCFAGLWRYALRARREGQQPAAELTPPAAELPQ